MIQLGLGKPLFIFGEPAASSATAPTGAWASLEIPTKKDGGKAHWVALSIGHLTPATPGKIWFQPGYSATDDPAAGNQVFCPIYHAWWGPCVLDVSGFTHVHVRSLAVAGVDAYLTPIEEDGRGMNQGPLASPPKLCAAGVTGAATTSSTASIAIPNTAAGSKAKYVMVTRDNLSAAMQVSYISPNLVARTPILPFYMSPYILDVAGVAALYFRMATGSGTTNVHVSPLENH